MGVGVPMELGPPPVAHTEHTSTYREWFPPAPRAFLPPAPHTSCIVHRPEALPLQFPAWDAVDAADPPASFVAGRVIPHKVAAAAAAAGVATGGGAGGGEASGVRKGAGVGADAGRGGSGRQAPGD